MARNEEKQYGRLNRLILQRQREDYLKHHPKRPKLDSLDNVDDIKKWLPSIKRDMDFYLKKSQVVCYSEEHIIEARLMVEKLHREYKAFLRKIKNISPGTEVPWVSRPYKGKFEKAQKLQDSESKLEFVRIPLPILDQEVQENNDVVVFRTDVDLPMNDKPLEFNFNRTDCLNADGASQDNEGMCRHNGIPDDGNVNDVLSPTDVGDGHCQNNINDKSTFSLEDSKTCTEEVSQEGCILVSGVHELSDKAGVVNNFKDGRCKAFPCSLNAPGKSVLGLDYDLSSDDESGS